jgi:subtilisin
MNSLRTNPDELLLASLESGGDGIYTGRQIVTFREGALEEGLNALATSDTRVARSSDFSEGLVSLDDVGDAGMMVFEELGVAVLDSETGAAELLQGSDYAAAADSAIEAVEPETFVFAQPHESDSYLAGFQAAIDRIRQDLRNGGSGEDGGREDDATLDAEIAAVTWGLAAVRAPLSRFSGRNIKVAVLDTGFALGHPDFVGRPITAASFVGQPVMDLHGHGTHCTGTACGPRTPAGVPRYGIAYESLIHIGKVLTNTGTGTTAGILAGMNWAVARRCEVISMSLGGGTTPSAAYTAAGQAALNAGCLVIAAAGNNSSRPGFIAPTIAPANSPTVVSVAALDERLQVARFSCGGKVEIAGPGVNVFSSLPLPRKHGILSGTSMATPHVAGVAALIAQSNPAFRGIRLRDRLLRTARPLPFPPRDVGRGLAQAPVLVFPFRGDRLVGEETEAHLEPA